jgi:hypothetical protein
MKKVLCFIFGHRLKLREVGRIKMSTYDQVVYQVKCSWCGGVAKTKEGQHALRSEQEPHEKKKP